MKSPQTLIDRYATAVAELDREAMVSLYSPTLRMFDMVEPWELRGLAAWQARVESWFSDTQGSSPKAIPRDVEIQTTNEMALVTMLIAYEDADDSGTRVSMTNRLTWIAIPDGDDWKIIHEHTSVPLDEESMSPQFQP